MRQCISWWLIDFIKCKQDLVSRPSTKAEYPTMYSAYSNIIWLPGLLAGLSFPPSTFTPIYADNKSAIHLAMNKWNIFNSIISSLELNLTTTLLHWRIFLLIWLVDLSTKSMAEDNHSFLNGKLMPIAGWLPRTYLKGSVEWWSCISPCVICNIISYTRIEHCYNSHYLVD